jgi:toluene monooxygenase system ferredoxin subunit
MQAPCHWIAFSRFLKPRVNLCRKGSSAEFYRIDKAIMAFVTLCKLDALYQGSSTVFVAEGREVLLVWPYGDAPRAFQGTCPHQQISLADALFNGETLICQAHRWTFNARTGQGQGPHFCQLAQYALRLDEGVVAVDVACIVSPGA